MTCIAQKHSPSPFASPFPLLSKQVCTCKYAAQCTPTIVYDIDVAHVPQVGVVHLDALLAVVGVGQVPPLALHVQ